MGNKKTLLAAALLAATVSVPSMAGPQAISDDQLGEVSAQGIQVVTNSTNISNQQNNNDSVQANGNSQANTSGMQVMNMVNSAANTQTNTAAIDTSIGISSSQSNTQYAENHEASSQTIDNFAAVSNQNNNNATVQMNDSSQMGTTAGIVSNVAGSAMNIGQNIASITNSSAIGLAQSNSQTATNEGYDEQYITNGGNNSTQNNNNSSVQVNSQSQSSSSTFVLNNTSSSASNIGQNFVFVDGLLGSNLSQSNYQMASNDKIPYQEISNGGNTTIQNNNNGSVQINDDGQTNASSIALSNTANSAKNIGQNIVDATNMNGVNVISQSNEQYAYNGAASFSGLYQTVINGDVSTQNNNNQSVQLNSNAQASTNAVSLSNTANSSENIAQNVADVSGAVSINVISSSNYQEAYNYTRWEVVQNVASGDSDLQRNNNNSVQLNENAQNASSGMSISNTSASASNIGQNLANTGQIIGFNIVSQSNEQYAYNGTGWSNWSFQTITNNDGVFTLTTGQDNNNASVQMNDGATAQNDVNAINLSNVAHSATNTAQNAAYVANVALGNIVIQSNYQVANNDSWTSQEIGNYGLINVNVDQDNNNASVQIQDGQNRVNSFATSNVSNSAANTAQNVVGGSNVIGLNAAVQTNESYASNNSLSQQAIGNNGLFVQANISQDNNNASVQLQGGQNDFNGMSLANVATSASNVGQNVASYNTFAQIGLIGQSNTQGAYEYVEGDQTISNASLIISASLLQDNNNNSVQVNGGQDNANAMSFLNASASAANVGQNVGSLTSLAQIGLIGQYNYQESESITTNSQTVDNLSLVLDVNAAQNNNNGSVQVNGAQNNVSTLSFANAASSAMNVGQNILNMSDLLGVDLAEQINSQSAYNSSYSEQAITNNGVFLASVSLAQDNNNASVQLNNSQNNGSGLSFINTSNSALNNGMNIANITNPLGLTAISQMNDQYAENSASANQDVSNDLAVAQNNNNGSVQLNSSQNSISSMAVLNTSLAAVNNGINLANISGSVPFGTIVSQSNYQTAINDSDSTQTISNLVVIAGQNNNNGSVQLNNSQFGASSLVLGNIVNSAANTGFNMAAITGASGWTLNQVSVQNAINY